jgi:hypothetical protein
MRKLLSTLFALAVAAAASASAYGGSMSLLGVGSAPGGGGGSATFTPGANVTPKNNGFAAGTVSFTGLNGGTNYPSGAVVLVGVVQDQSALTLTSPQIGGNAASIVSGAQDSSTHCTLYQATMPSSSSDTFSFTNGAAVNVIGAVAGYFTNLTSSTPTATGNETFANQPDPQFLSASITVPSSGFGVAFVGTFGATPPTAVTWTNTTASAGDTFAALATKAAISLSHTTTAGSWMGGSGAGGVSGVTNNMNFVACMSAAAYH